MIVPLGQLIKFEQECVVKKFKIKFGNSLGDKTTRKEGAPSKKPSRLVFEDELTRAPSDEVNQKTMWVPQEERHC